MRSIAIALLAMALTTLVAVADESTPSSPKAVEAKQKYAAALEQARQAYGKAIIAADQRYISELDSALKDAMRKFDMDLARALDDQKKAAIKALGEDQDKYSAVRSPEGPVPTAGSVFRDCPYCPEMVVIPPGRFMMGTDVSETSRQRVPEPEAARERPRHAVSINVALAVGKYDVTRAEYARFVEATDYAAAAGCGAWSGTTYYIDSNRSWRNPGFPQTDRDPVVCVNWADAKAYATWLSRTTGKGYRLLTEAEWEYAARGGTTTARWWGDDIGHGNTSCSPCGSQWDDRGTSPAGSFAPNPFGLYDMLGNAWQWVEDCFIYGYAGAPVDASIARTSGDCVRRPMRGGSWNATPYTVRAGYRYDAIAGDRLIVYGFRVARKL